MKGGKVSTNRRKDYRHTNEAGETKVLCSESTMRGRNCVGDTMRECYDKGPQMPILSLTPLLPSHFHVTHLVDFHLYPRNDNYPTTCCSTDFRLLLFLASILFLETDSERLLLENPFLDDNFCTLTEHIINDDSITIMIIKD